MTTASSVVELTRRLIAFDTVSRNSNLELISYVATLLEGALRGAKVPMAPRPRQDAPLRLLTSVNMPAALVEMAYLTNGDQATQVRGDEFRNNVADALYEAVARFRTLADGKQSP